MSSTASWAYGPIENIAREKVLALPSGQTIWSQYEMTRQDVGSSILPYIATQEPGLSDHGIAHIANVMDNVGRVLGMNPSGAVDPGSRLEKIGASELLLLLLGALLHDIGNILGRERHNQVTEQTWRKSGKSSYNLWQNPDRKTIMALCQAHTGKASDGSKDTLKPLSASAYYFLGSQVPIGRLAAILRFSDELAEGEQRTSRFLLFQRMYDRENNEVFHRYAHCTNLTIDAAGDRVALDFRIELDDFQGSEDSLSEFRELLSLIFKRIAKLDDERVLTRAYAGDWLPFKEVSVVLEIVSDGDTIIELPQIVLNDFNTRAKGGFELRSINKNYDLEEVISKVEAHLGS
ncbi:MAG: hypothetical protein GW855_05705 [Erythrobacter sp.]|nr:hypothetical protein [Erythrobacter sp.]NCQ62853.1 hypothetical protein [Alphaproteobacteria bacterium]